MKRRRFLEEHSLELEVVSSMSESSLSTLGTLLGVKNDVTWGCFAISWYLSGWRDSVVIGRGNVVISVYIGTAMLS